MRSDSLHQAARHGARRDAPGASSPPLQRWVALILLVLHVGGCYRYVPVNSNVVEPGMATAVRINDQGRVALTPSIGPGVVQITGVLRANRDTMLVMDMYSVQYMDIGAPVRMSGERVEISRSYVQEFSERRLSRSRTWTVLGIAGAGLIASLLFVVGGFGGGNVDDLPGGGGGGNPD